VAEAAVRTAAEAAVRTVAEVAVRTVAEVAAADTADKPAKGSIQWRDGRGARLFFVFGKTPLVP